MRGWWRGTLGWFLLAVWLFLGFGQSFAQEEHSDADGWIQERILGRGSVEDIALSPDDKMLAVAGSIGVWLYRFPSLEDYAYIPHDPILQSVSWSPDGTRLATGDWDFGVVRIWEIQDQNPRLISEYGQGREVVWSPVDEYLAIFENWSDTGYGDTVWLVEPESGFTLLRLKAQPNDRLAELAWSSDGRRIAARSYDGNFYLWRLPTQLSPEEDSEITFNLRLQSEEALSLSHFAETDGEQWLLRNGQLVLGSEYLLLIDEPYPLSVRNATTGEVRVLLDHGSHLVVDYDWTQDGKYLVVVRNWGEIEAWDLASGEHVTQRRDYYSWDSFRELLWSQDGTRIAAGGDFGRLWVWDLRLGEPRISLERHPDPLVRIVWSPDVARLAALDRGGRLWIWDAVQAEVVKKLEINGAAPSVGRHDDMAWSPDGKWFVVKDSSGWPWSYAWDTETWRHSQAQPEMDAWFLSPSPKSTKGVRYSGENLTYSFHSSPDGSQLALGKWDGTVILMDAQSKETLHVFDDGWNGRGRSVIDSVAWSPDGRFLAAGGTADTLWIWDVASRELLAEFDEPAFPITSIAWSPDGLRLASTGRDGVVRIWRAP